MQFWQYAYPRMRWSQAGQSPREQPLHCTTAELAEWNAQYINGMPSIAYWNSYRFF
jgi:hypothetical protein